MIAFLLLSFATFLISHHYHAEGIPLTGCDISSVPNREMIISVNSRRNHSGDWITKFSAKKNGFNISNEANLQVNLTVTEENGLKIFHLHGILTEKATEESKLSIIPRDKWDTAKSKKPLPALKLPATYVLVAGNIKEMFNSEKECKDKLKKYQTTGFSTKPDIFANFYLCTDGNVYEGRGWEFESGFSKESRNTTIVIDVMGDFKNNDPSPTQLDSLKKFIEEGVRLGKISKDYKLVTGREYGYSDPEQKLYDEIKSWVQFTSKI